MTATIQERKPTKNLTLLGWTIVGLGALFYCYEYLLRIAPGAMVPQLMQDMSISAQGLGLMVGLYYVAYTPMQAIVGIIHDIYGPRRILTLAVALCLAGSLVFTMTHDITLASIGRFLVGLGSAFAFVGVLKLAAIWLPLNRFAMVAGLVTALGMLAGMFGTIGLTQLTQNFGWKVTLLGSTLIGVILLPLMWFFVRDNSPDSPEPQLTRLSYKETFLNLLKIIKNPQMWIVGTIGFVLYLSLSVFAELWGDEYIAAVYGYQQSESAFLNSMVFLGWLIGSPLIGWLSDKICRRRPFLTFACFSSAAVFLVFLFATNLSLHWYVLSFLFFLFGFLCSAENICFAMGRENAHPALAGSAISYINMLVMLGGLIFQPLVGKLLDLSWSGVIKNGVPIYSAQDYKFALFFIPLALVVGGFLSFLLKETYAKGVEIDKPLKKDKLASPGSIGAQNA